MPFTEIPGDLFVDSNPTDALAHCVSQDLRMGKGIATIFKERFNGIAELKRQNKKVGEVAYLHRQNRYIFYLITKPTAWDKPTEEDFKKSLTELRKLCEQFEVSGLSLPRIGAVCAIKIIIGIKFSILRITFIRSCNTNKASLVQIVEITIVYEIEAVIQRNRNIFQVFQYH
ncbi:hypothetical protein C2G38_1482552 [Gigaspora rosea]|uniref:ADP-ribose 1''-phosphate phosphatase n=1 Tax=Gigaspora rosea TaxID=44941 RepID=A0A397W581_9GLOM|nr:hypothetical protein C2G38_1482552 [Gigaspora rosea]